MTINDQLEVWSWCIGRQAELDRRITSPFRTDTHPSCVLRDHQGTVHFLDVEGKTGHGFTCHHAVAWFRQRYRDGKLDLRYAKSVIDYNLAFGKRPILNAMPVLNGSKRSITEDGVYVGYYPNGGLQASGWTEKDIEYWSKRGIGSAQLENTERGGRVYSCSHYIINKSVFEAQGLCFAYTINDKVKIYQPEAPKEYKWFSTVTQYDYWHTQRGCSKLFIAKSNKDHLEAENLFPTYDILSGMNEATMPPNLPEILDCYTEAIAVFDEDDTGLTGLKYLRDLGVKTFVVDVQGCKDIDDVIVKGKTLKFKEIL